MKIFISGGVKNGKSHYALTRAKELAEDGNLPLYYVATMIPGDREDEARIKRHIEERRGLGFTTIEQGRDISKILTPENREGVFLLDSVTALLANVMFDPESDYRYNEKAGDEVLADLLEFSNKAENIIFVSDYIYGDTGSDLAPEADHTEDYIKALARVDRGLAKACHEVIEISAGLPIKYK